MYSLLYTEAAPRNEQPFHASVNDSSFGQSPAQENRGDVFHDKPSSETPMSDLFKGVQEPSWKTSVHISIASSLHIAVCNEVKWHQEQFWLQVEQVTVQKWRGGKHGATIAFLAV